MIINASAALPRLDLEGAYQEYPAGFMGVADQVMPEFEVPSVAGKGWRVTREEVLGIFETARAPKSAYRRSDDRVEDFDYTVGDHGLTSALDDRERRTYANAFSYDEVVAMRLRDKILRAREYTVANMLVNVTNFPISGTTGHQVGTAWTNAGATPIADFNTAVGNFWANCGMQPDTLVINWAIARALSTVTTVIARLSGSGQPGPIAPGTPLTAAQLSAVFGVNRVVIADAPYSTAKQGQAATISHIWSSSYAFVCRTSASPDISQPCIGRMWRYTEDEGALGTVLLEQYRDEDLRSDVMRARFGYGAAILDSTCGYLMKIIP